MYAYNCTAITSHLISQLLYNNEHISLSQWCDGVSFLWLAEQMQRNHWRHLIWRAAGQSLRAGGGA